MSDGTSSLGSSISTGAASQGGHGARVGGQPSRGAARNLKPLWTVLTLAAVAVPVLLLVRGCEADLAIHYGSRQALFEGDSSINGLGVISEMFSRAGHRVTSTTRLTPRIGRSADVIVWFIQDFTPPSAKAVDWLNDWLEDRAGRTLIVVGRDFDAEPLYWSKVAPQASGQDAAIVASKGSLAGLRFITERTPATTQPEDWGWFKLDRSASLKQRGVTTLTGDPNWTAGVDATKVELELNGRIKPNDEEDEILLETPGDILVFRHRVEVADDWSSYVPPAGKYAPPAGKGIGSKQVPWYQPPSRTPSSTGSSHVVVVTNGSFLLNMPLVNHEHRKLAGALVNEVGQKKSVFFLEAGGAPEVLDHDPPPPRMPISTMYFDVPRIQNLLWHLAVFTLIVCFGLFAIHGRPRQIAGPPPSDFGRHVEALGDLLSQTKDAAYAQARLAQYRNSIRGEGSRRGKT